MITTVQVILCSLDCRVVGVGGVGMLPALLYMIYITKLITSFGSLDGKINHNVIIRGVRQFQGARESFAS